MEFALPELLSRNDIIRILNHRQLHVHNMYELTHDELLRVYKTFVMPLTKRPERSKINKKIHMATIKNDAYDDQYMPVEALDNICNSMDIDFTCVEKNNVEMLKSSSRLDSPVGEKRRQRSSDEDILHMLENDYQYQLSSVTKRIRINSLA